MELKKIYRCLIFMRKTFILLLAAGLFFWVSCKSKKPAVESPIEAAVDTAIETKTETTSEIDLEIKKTRNKPRGGGSLKERLARQEEMYSSIGITEAQKEKFRAIETSYSKKMRAAKNENNGSKEAMMTALKELQTDKTSEIKMLLTSDQFTKYETQLAIMLAERRQPK
jgi:hypothetical protein